MPYPKIKQFSSNHREVTIGSPYPVPVGDWLTKGLKTSNISIGLTPMALPTVAMIDRRFISIYNNSDYTIYLGEDTTITTGRAHPLESKQPFAINLDQNVIFYGVGEAALTPCDVRIMEGA